VRIAIFDYAITPNNPVGSCHRHMLAALCRNHEFTVFAVEFDNPCPERIRFVRVPAIRRPLAALFLNYQIIAPMIYFFHRLRRRVHYDLVQFVESNLSFGDVCYSHFCHRAYLKEHWTRVSRRGIRAALRWLNHWLHAVLEPRVYRKARWIIVPSVGLKRILEMQYLFVRSKVTVVPNPVDLRQWEAVNFDREGFRKAMGFQPDDIVLVFVALGNFEHKGLKIILEALKIVGDCYRLIVVGGYPDLVKEWRTKTLKMGLVDVVHYVGMQKDIRPYLWAADLFVLPSQYETFPLVALQAAAAGLPLLVTRLHGVEEFMLDCETGFTVERSRESVARGLRRFGVLTPHERKLMGQRAREAVQRYDVGAFVEAWRRFYHDIESELQRGK